LDALKRLFGQLVGAPASSGSGNEVMAVQTELGAHGDHWGCVFRAVEEPQLLEAVHDLVKGDGRAEIVAGGDGTRLLCSPGERLRLCALVRDGKVISAYPEAARGPVWQVMVMGILVSATGLEACITGECHGSHVNFFDTRYLANRERYEVGRTYEFRIAAFAYTLERAGETEAESEIGAKVSFRGAHAYMPAATSNEAAEIDDYWFHSPLEGESWMEALAGKYLRAYPVVLALPEEFPMALTLYAAGHVTSPDVLGVQPGEDLEGFLWLQGHLSNYEL
jgi:hypothetical protein